MGVYDRCATGLADEGMEVEGEGREPDVVVLGDTEVNVALDRKAWSSLDERG